VVVIDEGVAKNLPSSTLKRAAYAFIFDQQGLMANLSKAQSFLELRSDKTTAKLRAHCALTALAFPLYEYVLESGSPMRRADGANISKRFPRGTVFQRPCERVGIDGVARDAGAAR
jgi:hypothetical protein